MSTCPTFETEGFGFNNNTAFQDRILKCLNQNFASQSSTGKGIDDQFDLVSKHELLVVCLILAVVCLFFVAASIFLWNKVPKLTKAKSNIRRILSDKTPSDTESEWDISNEMRNKLIPITEISQLKSIGRGEFSNVYSGQVLTNESATGQSRSESCVNVVNVAIKMPNHFIEDMNAVVNEIKIFCDIGHHLNIVRFHGISFGNISPKEIYIITELCENGSLLNYIRTREQNVKKANSIQDEIIMLLKFGYEISLGMVYLSERKIIHGDLAARNIFLDASLICKIGDFGLSIKEGFDNNLSCTKVPWKWRPPESMITNNITQKSDVWSYGVTVWEIFSFGRVPYPGISFPELFTFLKNNNRLTKPRYASQEIYEIMLKCWRQLPNERPSFDILVEDIAELRRNYNIANKTTE